MGTLNHCKNVKNQVFGKNKKMDIIVLSKDPDDYDFPIAFTHATSKI